MIHIRSLIGTLFAAVLFMSVGLAYAESDQPRRNSDQVQEDSVSRHDREEFARKNTSQHSGKEFHRHERSCVSADQADIECHARVTTDNVGIPLATTIPGSALRPAQLRSAYGVTGISTAAKPPVIAIVDAYDHPNIQSDLNVYSTAMGIPTLPACSAAIANSATPCFKKVDQRGGTRYPRANSGWALEIALDVEAAHAMCQNCSILLVEADSNSFSNLMSAVDRAVALGSKIVSNSYGGTEFASETAFDYHFNVPGVAFTVSSGDSGYGVQYPAASRYVTAVGGTSLYLNTDGSYNAESVWSGAGSGCSAYESKQLWQKDPNCTKRTVADISAVADPNTGMAVYDSVTYSGQKGWFQIGGTSLASPVVAALYALSNNAPYTSAANSFPYSAPAGSFHDILSGANGACGGVYLCMAFSGYDGPTGIGTPNGLATLAAR